MSEIKDHRDLEAWQVVMEMVSAVYLLSSSFPETERYGLTSQMRRAAVSVPSNIAEGQARGPTRAGLNHFGIALGSLAELATQIEIAVRLGFVTSEASEGLNGLIVSSRKLTGALKRAKAVRLGISPP